MQFIFILSVERNLFGLDCHLPSCPCSMLPKKVQSKWLHLSHIHRGVLYIGLDCDWSKQNFSQIKREEKSRRKKREGKLSKAKVHSLQLVVGQSFWGGLLFCGLCYVPAVLTLSTMVFWVVGLMNRGWQMGLDKLRLVGSKCLSLCVKVFL
jgi:hypothetical protein